MTGHKKINDYIFYKIISKNHTNNLCYVGSTTNFAKRQTKHKLCSINGCYKNSHLNLYKNIRANGGWDEFQMVEIGRTEQITLAEAHSIEDTFRIELKADMNMRCCVNNKQKRSAYNKIYRDENKEGRRTLETLKMVCVCGCSIRKYGLSQHLLTKKHIKIMNMGK